MASATAQEIAEELHRLQTAPPGQLSRADLAVMSPDEINKARRDGRLVDVLAGRDPGSSENEVAGSEPRPVGDADQGARGAAKVGQITSLAEVRAMSPAAINEARRAGRLDRMLTDGPVDR